MNRGAARSILDYARVECLRTPEAYGMGVTQIGELAYLECAALDSPAGQALEVFSAFAGQTTFDPKLHRAQHSKFALSPVYFIKSLAYPNRSYHFVEGTDLPIGENDEISYAVHISPFAEPRMRAITARVGINAKIGRNIIQPRRFL